MLGKLGQVALDPANRALGATSECWADTMRERQEFAALPLRLSRQLSLEAVNAAASALSHVIAARREQGAAPDAAGETLSASINPTRRIQARGCARGCE